MRDGGRAHTAVAVKALGDETLTRRILEDHTSAPDPKLRATLRFLEKLCLTPADVTPADAKALLEAGVSRQAVADAVYVCFLFSTYTRLADTLGWEVPSAAAFDAGAKSMLKGACESCGRTGARVGGSAMIPVMATLFVAGRFSPQGQFRSATYDVAQAMIVNAAMPALAAP